MISNKTREYRIENIRAIAILTVVLGHSMILYSNGFDIYQSGRNSAFFDYAKRFINLYQMPLFFSLSGYLFAKSSVRTSASVFFRKKAARILLPFLLVGLFWLLPIRWAIRYPGYSECTLKGTIVMFLAGTDSGHLWFLPVLFLYFAVSYLLTKLFKNRLLTWTIAVLLGIGFALVEQLIPEMPLDTMYPRYFARYFWSFPAGALLCWRKDDLTGIFRKPLTRFLTAILCAAVMITAVFVDERLSLPASAVIIFTLYAVVPEKQIAAAEHISKNSFGLYLLHSPLTYITYCFALSDPPAAVFAINVLLWGAVAWLITVALRKTPLRFVIGE